MMRRGLLPLVWLKHMAGARDEAQALWQQARTIVQQAQDERVGAQLEILQAQLQLAQAVADGTPPAAALVWAETYRQRQPDPSRYGRVSAQMTLAHVELVEGQTDQAIRRLQGLQETAAAGGHHNNLVKIRALQALAHQAQGDEATALERLGAALSLAAPEGYARTFIDLGPPMHALLQEAAARGLFTAYVSGLLAAISAHAPVARLARAGERPTLPEPLSGRELALLRLLAAGRSNREIAGELYLSVNTIKVYASRLYAKLGVHRRGEAVARGRELGLI
jgi:LuxR family maltose regulon positive regulatory protein